MAEKQYYTAIDLGTTNSVIAYGNIVREKMKPIVLELDRKNDTGSTSRGALLPSVVFYYKNNEGEMVTDIGDYAKSRYGTRAGYVCKSVKSLMGVTDQVPLVDEISDKTPSDVSAQILSYMINGAKKRLFQQELNDVIITVPASFDSDQCNATISAAKKAGIDVNNTHDILLYEPKAVIYDFMRMQEDGEIPSDLLSLDTEKNVMVFDLGGGTLDVTLHRVGYTESGIIDIKDIAISRYTLLGGDNYDELLAVDMLKRFEEMYDIKVGIKRKEEVMCKLRKLAEKMKTDLSLAYENAHMADVELPDDYEVEVMDINLYDSYAYEDIYTKVEIEEIVAPLMGYNYKFDDFKQIDRLDEKDVDNIIYPILDVLDKAGVGVNVDAVILNGGMTKFYLVRKRLKEFFGFQPLETSDPDLSVARGAVYYHYCLHKYNVNKMKTEDSYASEEKKQLFRNTTILNDSINLGLRSEYVSLLIPAGTDLPFKSEEIRDKYKLDRETDVIGIELFLGRGKTKNLPNRKIATRTVHFDKVYTENTPISFQIYINALRMMTMEAWITGKPKTRNVMEIDVASLKSGEKTSKGIRTTEKIHLNAVSEINNLKALTIKNRNRTEHDLNRQILGTVDAISQASNPQDFFEPCMDILNKSKQSDFMRAYIYDIASNFNDEWTDAQKRRVLNIAKKHFEPYASMVKQSNFVMIKAVKLIAIMESDFINFFSEYMIRVPEAEIKVRQTMIRFALMNEPDEDKLINFLEKHFNAKEVSKWIAWSIINRYGRGTNKENHKKLTKIVKKIADTLKTNEIDEISKLHALILAEIFSNDTENPLQSDEYTSKIVWKAIEKYIAQEPDVILSGAVKKICYGTELTDEEKKAVQDMYKSM